MSMQPIYKNLDFILEFYNYGSWLTNCFLSTTRISFPQMTDANPQVFPLNIPWNILHIHCLEWHRMAGTIDKDHRQSFSSPSSQHRMYVFCCVKNTL